MPPILEPLFRPKNMALIGASERPGSLGQAVFKNLAASEYKGIIYLVNLRRSVVYNQTAYSHVGDLPERVDLALIATPDRVVPKVLEECAEAGVRGAIILSPAYASESFPSEELHKQIRDLNARYGIRVLGPDCLGYIGVYQGLNASLIGKLPLPGNLAIISQSGAMLTALLDMAASQNTGFSHVISVGRMMEVNFADLIDFLGTDPKTACILIYMEEVSDARRFMSAARAFARSKPIVVLKAGRSPAGLPSRTADRAPEQDAAYDAAFRRAGIVRVNTLAQLFNCGLSLGKQPRPHKNRLAILTNAGGPAVLAVDHLLKEGGQLAKVQAKSLETLREKLTAFVKGDNPVELAGEAPPADFREALLALLHEPQVDGILIIITPQNNTALLDIAREIAEVSRSRSKPVLASWMGDSLVRPARAVLDEGNIPHYRYPESAIDVFLFLYQYARRIRLLYETPPSVPEHLQPDSEGAAQLIREAQEKGRLRLNEFESKTLLQCYMIPVVSSYQVNGPEEAVAAADQLDFPVALKVLSPDLTRKSAVGGVKLNLYSPEAVRTAYAEILENVRSLAPEARLEGMLVEPMVRGKMELLFQARHDPVLGPFIAFGKGGLAAEVYRDYHVELPPLNMALAYHLLEATRIYPILKGIPGVGGVDLEHLAVTLYKFAYLLMDFPEIREISINPFLARTQGGLGVDAHVILGPEKAKNGGPDYGHLIISPYPSRFTRKARLRNGQEVILRPIRPEDEPLEMNMIDHLSRQTLYFRFFGQVPKVSHEWLSRFTHIDYDREMAIIAELIDEGEHRMIGVVRIIQDPAGESAEYAITVADPWQGQGLGSLLTDFILEIARDKGLKKIYASLLATNDRMLNLFKRRGFRIKRDDFETYSAELDLN